MPRRQESIEDVSQDKFSFIKKTTSQRQGSGCGGERASKWTQNRAMNANQGLESGYTSLPAIKPEPRRPTMPRAKQLVA